MTFPEAKAETETNNKSREWFWCWLGIHWCSEWSEPDDDEHRYQYQRCLRCNMIWERRIPVA